jgi:hypothetical protein
MTHERRRVVLLGDSIFDNAAYTSGAPDVVTHLRRLLPSGWEATLLARDGATTAGLETQLERIPADASHLVISVGGNDALQNMDLLSLPVASSGEALAAFAARLTVFENAYRSAVRKAIRPGLPAAVCTVYNGALGSSLAAVARLGVALFNDVILRTAIDFRLDALELRSICTEDADYANPIEPSDQGGLKIARAIARLAGALPAGDAPSRAWGAC